MVSQESIDITPRLLGLQKTANMPHLSEEERIYGRLFLAHSGPGCTEGRGVLPTVGR